MRGGVRGVWFVRMGGSSLVIEKAFQRKAWVAGFHVLMVRVRLVGWMGKDSIRYSSDPRVLTQQHFVA